MFPCLYGKELIFSEAEQLQPWCGAILLNYSLWCRIWCFPWIHT